ncbi:bifunctional phosphopantothenoylcysteine decarboxylase/phosphopantothenate--cysteine ligase CoaBC [Lactobacillus pasteurii]|uniref:Coenzyme A biosynthesis bifunctional protein CoaBC n=1 Tax=Lactobacillus pasteurii DSM 23907 = CRBIP 24.76 TaxID=1423790 RepID=I7LB85_9LACO|nr:bifunctional phosphopantothenoylcysteine decarboxylase/phosphopantothenate--cysteine ligase CoaBC [Lactobacillus pasteurii]TDG76537.1 hypothetical protein C5L33_001296 [Lactobacillus pasteurii]CCI85371.1 Phosphopantothenate--cysteine ligase [Lactobacillus pasteurii DSM 23907 = CRBIP 24.76]
MKITVYMTGGIAVYKAVEVVRHLQKAGHKLRVVMTKNAERFVSSNTLAALTKQPVLDDLWTKEHEATIPHIELARWTQLAIVVPASANFLAKMANGIADDAASTTILATAAPKAVVPAMNDQMWSNPATQRNLSLLKKDGIAIMEPVVGLLAEGYQAKGRMPEPDQIFSWLEEKYLTANKRLQGKKIIVSAGGTIESIDPVRYISNHSSGKMGIEIAKAARDAGADVTLVYGNIQAALPDGINTIAVKSAQDMYEAIATNFNDADVLIMAAAVGDWRAKTVAKNKLKKQADQAELQLTFVKNIDILKTLAHAKRADQLVIGFAAETTELLENAQRKLEQKGADYIVANDVSQNVFGSDEDQVTILAQNKQPEKWPKMTKKQVAEKLLNLIRKRF